jgi:hypothetical protein
MLLVCQQTAAYRIRCLDNKILNINEFLAFKEIAKKKFGENRR